MVGAAKVRTLRRRAQRTARPLDKINTQNVGPARQRLLRPHQSARHRAVTGRDGTVKECISANDYEIEVTFTLISTADEYPAEAMRQPAALARENSAVYVDSEFLSLFDIDRMVITEMEVNQETYGNTQTVKLKFDSDDEYDVAVTQG